MAPLLLIVSALPARDAAGQDFARVARIAYTWEGMFAGARATAMGGADIAIGDGPFVLALNPAPLMRGDGAEVATARTEAPWAMPLDVPDAEFVLHAASIEWNGWRLGFCRDEYRLDDLPLRTAYVAQTGIADVRESTTLVAVSRRVVDDASGASRLQWTAGAAYRRYANETRVVEGDLAELTATDGGVGSWDLGTTVAWRLDDQAGSGRVAVAVAWQNVFDDKRDIDGVELALPRAVELGATTSLAAAWRGREIFRATIAFARAFRLDEGRDDVNHAGFEGLVYRTLAVRVGQNQRLEDSFGWGLGLSLDAILPPPLRLAVDWGAVVPQEGSTYDDEARMWSVRAGMMF